MANTIKGALTVDEMDDAIRESIRSVINEIDESKVVSVLGKMVVKSGVCGVDTETFTKEIEKNMYDYWKSNKGSELIRLHLKEWPKIKFDSPRYLRFIRACMDLNITTTDRLEYTLMNGLFTSHKLVGRKTLMVAVNVLHSHGIKAQIKFKGMKPYRSWAFDIIH